MLITQILPVIPTDPAGLNTSLLVIGVDSSLWMLIYIYLSCRLGMTSVAELSLFFGSEATKLTGEDFPEAWP